MASAKTQGFALSTLPRSSNIPANAGAVDVKTIYDGVRQGLANLEMVRRAPASMLLADAEMKAKTAEAPLGTRQVLAQTEGIEQQTPLKTAILAAEASPEMQEAKRQALLNRNAKAASGDIQLGRALAEAKLRLLEDPADASAAQLVAVLEPMALKKSAASAANPQGVIDASVQRTADTNATRVATTADTNATRVATNDAAIAGRAVEGAANRTSDETIARERAIVQREATRAAREQRLAVVDAKHQLAFSRQLGALETLEQNTDNVNRLIDEAINLAGPTTTGIAATTAFLPFDARTLKGKLSSIRANVGFDALSNMRQSSPMGGALGPVSDVENKLLQDTIDAIDQGAHHDVLKENLEMVRMQRAMSLAKLKRTYDRDTDILKPGVGTATPAAPAPSPASPEVGKIYPDANGNRAKYLGNGQWEDVP